jgi:hypothetical protein
LPHHVNPRRGNKRCEEKKKKALFSAADAFFVSRPGLSKRRRIKSLTVRRRTKVNYESNTLENRSDFGAREGASHPRLRYLRVFPEIRKLVGCFDEVSAR